MTKRRGRPKHEPDQRSRDIVEALSGYGIPTEKIASVMGISRPTLLKAYRSEIDRGAAVVEAKLIGNLLRLSGGSDGTALKAIMFSLQCRFGWSQYALPQGSRFANVPEPERLGKKEALNEAAKTAHIGTRFDHLNVARQYPLGRKEARQLAAETAELGTEWEDLLH